MPHLSEEELQLRKRFSAAVHAIARVMLMNNDPIADSTTELSYQDDRLVITVSRPYKDQSLCIELNLASAWRYKSGIVYVFAGGATQLLNEHIYELLIDHLEETVHQMETTGSLRSNT